MPQSRLETDDEEVEFCLNRLQTVLGFSLPKLVKQYLATGNDEIPSTVQELIDCAQAALDRMRGRAGH